MSNMQDRPRGYPVKTSSDSAKAASLAESDEEAVDGFAPPLSCGWQRKCQRLFLWKRPVNGSTKTGRSETSRQENGKCQVCRSKGSRGTRFLLAELRGGSLLSGCRGETSGASRGKGPAQLSDWHIFTYMLLSVKSLATCYIKVKSLKIELTPY